MKINRTITNSSHSADIDVNDRTKTYSLHNADIDVDKWDYYILITKCRHRFKQIKLQLIVNLMQIWLQKAGVRHIVYLRTEDIDVDKWNHYL
jgi:hypothetical protein